MSDSFSASLDAGEAVLRFPYDERLRLLLRAIPGRRWDPRERVWRVPLEPEQAESLALLLAGLPGEPRVSDELTRAIARRRARRRREECVIDVARADETWSLSFATDAAPELVRELLEHPLAYSLPPIGRALVPFDDDAARLLETLAAQSERLRLSDAVSAALLARRERGGYAPGMLAADFAAAASRAHAPAWSGTIEVDGPREEPVFLLLGELARLPADLRERAVSAPGGASLPLTLDSWRLIDGRLGGWISHAARRCVAALEQGRPAPPAVLELLAGEDQGKGAGKRGLEGGVDTMFVLAPGHDAALLDVFAALAGVLSRGSSTRPFSPRARAPTGERASRLPAVHADPFCIPALDGFLAEHDVWVAPAALALLQDVREQHARGAGLVALSAAADADDLDIPGLGGELKPYQRAGVSYLLAQRRAFLADEQGLGKTVEALAALELDGAYPAVVVCPASLKLNWLAEIERWLPARRACALAGSGGGPSAAGDEDSAADITLVNYDILPARLQQLCALAPRALVLDESHYCKNAAAKRTQAARRLAAAVPHDGLVLALTGTPVMNRPTELVSQLRILGRLGDFGSGAKLARRFRGEDAHLRLHWHLRARCFVRRLKADVLPQLPAKTRAVVPVALDNEAEYRLAEHDVVAWLRSQPLDLRELGAKVAAALRAERLVRLNALKLLAARGKLHAALAWIHDFLSSGEPLVVFAHHREVQRAVLARFPGALHILGGDSPAARDAALRAFQGSAARECQLIVCSIEVAGHGITLTRASNVAFLELDWTPAKHDQAEDRCHRIGQLDAVNATYLLAAGTIDETIATLLEQKRAVIGAVTDGREQDEDGILDALVRELRGTPYRHLRAVA